VDFSSMMKLVLIILSPCITGFLFLALWIRNVQKIHNEESQKLAEKHNKEINEIRLALKDRVEFKELKVSIGGLERHLESNFLKLSKQVDTIYQLIVGDMDKKGMITQVHENQTMIEQIRKKM
jgi:hypothetical protein